MTSKNLRKSPEKVLFVCYGNACRSILAEALARHYWGRDLEAASAGLFPLGRIAAHTLEVLTEAGIPSDGLRSKGLADIRLEEIDYIVNLTELKIADLIPASFSGRLISHYVRDPYGEGINSFRLAKSELERLVRVTLPELIAAEKS